jgi:hypothetical protein
MKLNKLTHERRHYPDYDRWHERTCDGNLMLVSGTCQSQAEMSLDESFGRNLIQRRSSGAKFESVRTVTVINARFYEMFKEFFPSSRKAEQLWRPQACSVLH